MATQQEEEQQARDFLKRAEIKTMRKDLLKLREADSLKERDKIAKIETIEEQKADLQKKLEIKAQAQGIAQKTARDDVLQKNEKQEYAAEKDLKAYATEEERQQIFLFESQRLDFEKQIEKIEKEKDSALKLEKNRILLEIQSWQAKLSSIVGEEKKLEDEQKLIIEKEQSSTIPAEKKGLEQRRSEIDGEIQNIEKKRWGVEKQIQDLEAKVKTVDLSSDQLVLEKNSLRNKILGIDKSLREIYTGVIAREEDKKRGLLEAQRKQREALAKGKEEEKERVQRQQWTGKAGTPQKGFLGNAPDVLKEKMEKAAQAEEEQRKKFMQDVNFETNKGQGQPQQKSNIQ